MRPTCLFIVAGLILLPSASAGEFTGDTEKDRARILARRNWWSFQPIRQPAPPKVAANPIDAFILQALEAKKLRPSLPATRTQLIGGSRLT